jgi:hypothetical protein
MMPRKLFEGSIRKAISRNAIATHKIGKAVFPAKIKTKTTVGHAIRQLVETLLANQTYQQ